MSTAAPWMVAASAAIMLFLGAAHLAFTFRGTKLWPRDAELTAKMKTVSPVITRQTTMWRAWVGFNASHGVGLVVFGALYGYLAVAQRGVLFGSTFLLAFGLLVLLGYVALAQRYFFRTPLRSVVVATVLYAAAVMAAAL